MSAIDTLQFTQTKDGIRVAGKELPAVNVQVIGVDRQRFPKVCPEVAAEPFPIYWEAGTNRHWYTFAVFADRIEVETFSWNLEMVSPATVFRSLQDFLRWIQPKALVRDIARV